MKAIPFALMLALPGALGAAEVRAGDSLDEVRAELGAPNGQLRVGDRQLLYFSRGEVELRAGAVTRVALLTDEEQAAVEKKRASAAARAREETEVRRARLIAEGETLKARKLADHSFQAAPLSYQVAFWEDFSRRYAEVPVAEELTVARLRLAGQLEEKRAQAEQAGRLADLEARVREAEARAAVAESAAGTERRRANFANLGYGPSFGHGRADSPHRIVRPAEAYSPMVYRYFDAPLPYATSPGMPALQPTFVIEDSLARGERENAAATGHRPHKRNDCSQPRTRRTRT